MSVIELCRFTERFKTVNENCHKFILPNLPQKKFMADLADLADLWHAINFPQGAINFLQGAINLPNLIQTSATE